ncbi:ATP-dependent DNA helicase 2 subunit KU80, partial [Glycine soja]
KKKEALLLLLDVGPSMHSVLHVIERVCSMFVQKKVLVIPTLFSIFFNNIHFNPYYAMNHVDLVFIGFVSNWYQHVVVLKNTKVVDEDTVEALQQLPRRTISGDFLDVVIVGVDMLIKKFGMTNKGKKRLCLITNALCPSKESDEGTKEEQVTTIAKQMTAHGMKMESIILRGKFSMAAYWYENERLLDIFSKETSTRLSCVENPVSLFGALKTRNITPAAVFKGDLEFSPKLRIKNNEYNLFGSYVYHDLCTEFTIEDYLFSVTLFFFLLRLASRCCMQVGKTAEDKFPSLKKYSDKAPPNDKYAKHEVKWDAIKFKPEKGVKLLGFTDSSNVFRHHHMKDVYVFLPASGNTKAMLALSAVARAMKQMNKVAIVRCVWRWEQANVFIGVLTPNLSVRENIPNGLQLEAAANLIKTLDLAPHGQHGVLLPDFTSNPVLECFYCHLELKLKDPDAAVPPVDNTLKKITEPDHADLLLRKKSAIDSFCSSFELKGNPLVMGAQPANLIEKIGDLTPVQDFEALFSRRDSPDWVEKAINETKKKIFDLVGYSHEGDNYPKALECLVVLRKGCILEQEPKQFNDFLKHLCNFCQEKNLHSFCKYFASKELTLISKTEAVDIEVTDDEATSFLMTKLLIDSFTTCAEISESFIFFDSVMSMNNCFGKKKYCNSL